MMKPIYSIYDLICVLSDAESFNQGETIDAGRLMLGRNKHSEDWTSGRKIDRRIGKRLRAVNSGIGPRSVDIAPKISELRRSTGRLSNRPQERTMCRRIERSVDEPMTC